MYKCAGAKAAQMGTLDEVLAAAQKAKDNTRTVGFALTPCVIPEVGHSNFTLGENEMAMGMGIHGEPGVWNGPIKTADELAAESLDTLLKDMPLASGDEVALLINGLGATSIEELYILSNSVSQQLEDKGISIYRTFVGEFATSMEMMGASISIITLIGYTAIAGAVGAGGLGDLAVRYGYQRNIMSVMWVTVIFLIVLVQVIQSLFSWLSAKSDKRLR